MLYRYGNFSKKTAMSDISLIGAWEFHQRHPFMITHYMAHWTSECAFAF